MKEKAIEVLKHIQDPELGIDIWTLGLIREVKTDEEQEAVWVTMTFTTPLCPYGPQLVGDIKQTLIGSGFRVAEIEITFDPPWEPPEGLRETLGL